MIFRRRLYIAIGVMMAVLFALIVARGGVLFGTIGVENFSLCEVNFQDKTYWPRESLVLTPTGVVYGCGQLVVEATVSTVQCLRFYLNKGAETIAEPDDKFCLPSRSQSFLYPFESTLLRNPGKYRLYVYDPSSREWIESVAFEIRSNP